MWAAYRSVIGPGSGLFDGAHGALLSAGTAGSADIGIDLVLGLALRDSLDRALIRAGTAGNAAVGDSVSHDIYLHVYYTDILP